MEKQRGGFLCRGHSLGSDYSNHSHLTISLPNVSECGHKMMRLFLAFCGKRNVSDFDFEAHQKRGEKQVIQKPKTSSVLNLVNAQRHEMPKERERGEENFSSVRCHDSLFPSLSSLLSQPDVLFMRPPLPED